MVHINISMILMKNKLYQFLVIRIKSKEKKKKMKINNLNYNNNKLTICKPIKDIIIHVDIVKLFIRYAKIFIKINKKNNGIKK